MGLADRRLARVLEGGWTRRARGPRPTAAPASDVPWALSAPRMAHLAGVVPRAARRVLPLQGARGAPVRGAIRPAVWPAGRERRPAGHASAGDGPRHDRRERDNRG